MAAQKMRSWVLYALLIPAIEFFSGCSGMFLNYGYNISGNKVLYKNAFPGGTFEVTEADAKTFKIITEPGYTEFESSTGFATDKDHVFFAGHMLPGSDGKSFAYINRDFSKDKNQCYYHGEIIPSADPASFVIKDETFSTDKNNVYKRTMLMDNNSSVFETFDSSAIVHTANAVSVANAIVQLKQGALFKYLGYNSYSVDEQVYFQDNPVEGAITTGFEAFDNFRWKTAEHVYYGNSVIENADPKTYKPLASPYGKDASHIFFFERTIEGADPKTFEILNTSFQCSRDKHWAYHEDKRIKTVTEADMVNKNPCRQCNESAIYFEEK